MTKQFQLDPRLEADSHALTTLNVCEVRLANDTRWPWLILVPQAADVEELYELSPAVAEEAMREAAQVGEKLKSITSAEKINIAMIGNVVRQLHIHVVARSSGDENWPRPIWGHGLAEPYTDDHAAALIAHLRNVL